MRIIDNLKRIPLFSRLNESELNRIERSGVLRTFAAGEIVFLENSPADSMYVIMSGLVKIYKIDSDEQGIDICMKREGDFFGELAIIDGDLRSANVAAVEESVFYVLERDSFLKVLSSSTDMFSHVLTSLTRVIRNNSENIFREKLAKQNLQTEMEIERHRALSQMVAGVAHEINTPLGILRTASTLIHKRLNVSIMKELLDDERYSDTMEDILEAADLMQGNITRAHQLVESFKKTSVSQITGKLEDVDLPPTIAEIVGLFSLNAKRAGITVVVADDVPVENRHWVGYPGYLSQIILNLLSNIQRYAYPDRAGGKVDISLSCRNESNPPLFVLTIRDYGRGIASENLQKVFNAFYTTGRNCGGTGLGMAIVHNLATSALQGKVSIESEPGEGTAVTLIFPQRIKEAEPDREA